MFLTGAGISAESGIPTFRGPEGYWRVGSRNYQPMELATRSAFDEMPDEVWRWYLYRRAVCRAAQPNAAHRALVEAERAAGRSLPAGHPERRRPAPARRPVPRAHLPDPRQHRLLPLRWTAAAAPAAPPLGACAGRGALLAEATARPCAARCGAWLRPHVLWFDESYDEPRFRFAEHARRHGAGGAARRGRHQRRHHAARPHVRARRRPRASPCSSSTPRRRPSPRSPAAPPAAPTSPAPPVLLSRRWWQRWPRSSRPSSVTSPRTSPPPSPADGRGRTGRCQSSAWFQTWRMRAMRVRSSSSRASWERPSERARGAWSRGSRRSSGSSRSRRRRREARCRKR